MKLRLTETGFYLFTENEADEIVLQQWDSNNLSETITNLEAGFLRVEFFQEDRHLENT